MSETIETEISRNLETLTLEGQDKTQVNDGAVMVKKGSGKTKVRKGQTEEAYQIQKKQFEETGPLVNTLTWLEELDLEKLNPQLKTDRAKIEHLAERLYYKREYSKCLEISTKALDLFKDLNKSKIKNEIEELEYLHLQCQNNLESKTTTSSSS